MRKIIPFLFLLISYSAFAQTTVDPIDRKLDDCLNKDSSTSHSIECIDAAVKAWDEDLNRSYQILKKRLPAESFDVLKESQRQWINYRDTENKFIAELYTGVLSGSMFYSMATYRELNIIKTRAVELREYIEILDEFYNE